MKFILLNVILLYWKCIPAEKRNKCLFKISCSQYVYRETEDHGFFAGMHALRYRHRVCRQNHQLYINPITKEIEMLLCNGDIVKKEEIAVYVIE